MISKLLYRLKRKLLNLTIYKIDDFFEMRSKNYNGIRLFYGHYRINNRNNYGMISEKDLLNFIDDLPPETTMWDVGANVGYFSLYSAKKGFKVLAFEPDQMTCGVLNKNIFLNKLSGKILAIPVALNNETKISSLYMRNFMPANAYNTFDRQSNLWGQDFTEEFKQGAVGIKGDDLLLDESLHSLQYPEFIKIDVDGNEFKVLDGMKKILSKANYLCIELAYSHPEFEDVQNLLKDLGFSEMDSEKFIDRKRQDAGMRNFYYQKV